METRITILYLFKTEQVKSFVYFIYIHSTIISWWPISFVFARRLMESILADVTSEKCVALLTIVFKKNRV
jgi:hypothetical protein